MLLRQFFTYFLLIATLEVFAAADLLTLRGVTVFKAPFVEKDNATGKLKGFFVDLLDELARIRKFNYTLENLRAPQNSMIQDNFPSLLISDVLNHKADFALADSLFKIENYVRYVNFTEPYIVSGFSALVQKKLIERDDINNFEELLKKTMRPKMMDQSPYGMPTLGQQPSIENMPEGPKSDIQIGTMSSSSTYRLLTMATDPIGRQVYERLVQSAENLVDTRQAGVQRAIKSPYAFIQEAFNNELELDSNCDLTQLVLKPATKDSKPTPQLEYSIAVRKGYLHFDTLDSALRETRESGKLYELRQLYWNRKCNSSTKSFATIFVTFFSLAISLFLLS